MFTCLVDLTVVTVAIPYFFSACAQPTYLISEAPPGAGRALFSMWVTFASGYLAVYETLVAALAGILLYAFPNAHRQDVGQIPEPVDNRPGDSTRPTPPT